MICFILVVPEKFYLEMIVYHKFECGDIIVHCPSEKIYKVQNIVIDEEFQINGWVDETILEIFAYRFKSGTKVPLKCVINSYILEDLEEKKEVSISIKLVDSSCNIAEESTTRVLYGEGK